MADTIISMREMQRNYSKVIKQARTSRRPVFLSSRGKPEAVLLDVVSYESLRNAQQRQRKGRDWAEIKKALDQIRSHGKKNVTLSDFIHEDRQRHLGI